MASFFDTVRPTNLQGPSVDFSFLAELPKAYDDGVRRSERREDRERALANDKQAGEDVARLADVFGGSAAPELTTPSEGGAAAPPRAADDSLLDRAKALFKKVVDKGEDPKVAAAMVGNFGPESGFDTAAVGDNGTALGLGQWRHDRAARLAERAKAEGKPLTDEDVQIAHAIDELNTTERRAREAVLRSGGPEQAALAFAKLYERPSMEALQTSGPQRAKLARDVWEWWKAEASKAGQAQEAGAPATSFTAGGQPMGEDTMSADEVAQVRRMQDEVRRMRAPSPADAEADAAAARGERMMDGGGDYSGLPVTAPLPPRRPADAQATLPAEMGLPPRRPAPVAETESEAQALERQIFGVETGPAQPQTGGREVGAVDNGETGTEYASGRPRAAGAVPGLPANAKAAPESTFTPAQRALYGRLAANPVTRGLALTLIQQRMQPTSYSWQNVEGALYRTDNRGNAVKMGGGEERRFRTLTTAEERAAAGVPKDYTGPVQVEVGGKEAGRLHFPGKASTEVKIDQKGEGAFEKEFGQAQAKRWNEILENGANANKKLADIGQLREISRRGGNPGALAELKQLLGPWAASVGVDLSGLADIQSAEAIVQRLAPQMRVTGSGSTSDIEFKGMLRAMPRLMQHPEARERILDTMEAAARHEMKAAEIGERLSSGDITRAQAEKELRALPDPMAGFKQWREANGDVFKAASAAQKDGDKPKPEKRSELKIPMGAAQALRGKPELRAEFDAKYGTPDDPNPSNRVLGPAR